MPNNAAQSHTHTNRVALLERDLMYVIGNGPWGLRGHLSPHMTSIYRSILPEPDKCESEVSFISLLAFLLGWCSEEMLKHLQHYCNLVQFALSWATNKLTFRLIYVFPLFVSVHWWWQLCELSQTATVGSKDKKSRPNRLFVPHLVCFK